MVALYNAEKQELIGVFDTPSLASRYLFPFGKIGQRNGSNVSTALREKSRICNSDVANKIAVRKANQTQIELVGDGQYYINPKYRGFVGNSHMRFDTSKKEAIEGFTERVNRYWAEQKTKNETT